MPKEINRIPSSRTADAYLFATLFKGLCYNLTKPHVALYILSPIETKYPLKQNVSMRKSDLAFQEIGYFFQIDNKKSAHDKDWHFIFYITIHNKKIYSS